MIWDDDLYWDEYFMCTYKLLLKFPVNCSFSSLLVLNVDVSAM